MTPQRARTGARPGGAMNGPRLLTASHAGRKPAITPGVLAEGARIPSEAQIQDCWHLSHERHKCGELSSYRAEHPNAARRRSSASSGASLRRLRRRPGRPSRAILGSHGSPSKWRGSETIQRCLPARCHLDIMAAEPRCEHPPPARHGLPSIYPTRVEAAHEVVTNRPITICNKPAKCCGPKECGAQSWCAESVAELQRRSVWHIVTSRSHVNSIHRLYRSVKQLSSKRNSS